jgi:hypothetical protein
VTIAVSLSEKMAPVTMPTPELDFGKSAENCVTDAVIKFGMKPHYVGDLGRFNVAKKSKAMLYITEI